MNLLVDLGNTRLKWAVANDLGINTGPAIYNAEVNQNALKHLWQTIEPPNQLAVSCVGPVQLSDLLISVADELWPGVQVTRAKSQPSGFGVINAYQIPEKLGTDRWLSMIAAYQLYQTSLCIVSCGTAITVDVLDASGKHLGGLIAPGLRLMKEALATGTENLSLDESDDSFGLATYTNAAIKNGSLSATCGLIEFVLNKQPEKIRLVLTGGDAETIATQLSQPYLIEPDLVLKGLALQLRKSL